MAVWKRLASHSALLFAARLGGAGVTFLAQAAIARSWGSAILGNYLLIMATINLVAVVMPLGFETVGTYFAAEYRARDEGRLLRGFLVRAYIHVTAAALLLFLFGAPVASLFGAPGQVFVGHWGPACLLAFATALIFVTGALLVGLKRPFAGLFADAVFRPLVIIGGFVLALAATTPERSFDLLIEGIAIGMTVVALGQLVWLLRALREVPSVVPARSGEARRWWRFAAPWVIITLATDFFFDLDLLLLANLLPREELAIFGVCTRVFSLASFGVAVVYNVTLPEMFESEVAADRDGFHRKVGDANLVASGLAVLLLVVVGLVAPLALLIFGPGFEAGAVPLLVLCVALVVRSVFGPASIVLSVHNRPQAALPGIAIGLATLVLANLVLVPRFDLMGAAAAALLSIGLWSAAQWLTVFWTSGVDVSLRARLLRPREPLPAPAE